MKLNSIYSGDSLDVLKTFPDNSVDSLVCDPPYGYSFMQKSWDRAVVGVEIWQECLRVLKPGAFCMVMSAPRSDVQMHMISNLEQAGFRIDFTPIYWTYASGFPKAMNIGKMVDKRMGAEREVIGESARHGGGSSEIFEERGNTPITAPSTQEAKALDGSYAGFQPKPAVEVIIVAMKPLSEKTYVDQALKNGKGITWLDDCRVPTKPRTTHKDGNYTGNSSKDAIFPMDNIKTTEPQGRFPANLIVSDDVLNDGVERKSGGRDGVKKDKWTAAGRRGEVIDVNNPLQGDSGSYSRYFDLDKWANTLPFLITTKASKREKNEGLEDMETKPVSDRHAGYVPDKNWIDRKDGKGKVPVNIEMKPRANNHPTVKPLKLMSYLITLTTREGDTVLDPFCGSGTTCIAAKMLKRDYIGIEREAEYVEIAEARLKAHEPDKQVALDVG